MFGSMGSVRGKVSTLFTITKYTASEDEEIVCVFMGSVRGKVSALFTINKIQG